MSDVDSGVGASNEAVRESEPGRGGGGSAEATAPAYPGSTQASRAAAARASEARSYAWLRNRFRRPAVATWFVCLTLVAVHAGVLLLLVQAQNGQVLWSELLLTSVQSAALNTLGAMHPLALQAPIDEPWRLVTAFLLHGSLLHLVLNVLALRALGTPFEQMHGRLAFLAVIVVGSVTGSYATVLRGGVISVGASCGIMALAGALLSSVRGPEVAPAFASHLRRRLLMVLALTVVGGFAWNRWGHLLGSRVLIDNGGHVGGLLGGFAFGAVLPGPGPAAQSSARRRLARLVSIATIAGGLLAIVAGGQAVYAKVRRPGPGGDPVTWPLVAGPWIERETQSIPLRLALPYDWIELARDERHLVYGPRPGAPFLQVLAYPNSRMGSRANHPDSLTADLEKEVAELSADAPREGRIGGQRATVLTFAYRAGPGELWIQQVRYLVPRGDHVLHFVFLGPVPLASALARKIAGSVRFPPYGPATRAPK